jgi:hypothetical protein
MVCIARKSTNVKISFYFKIFILFYFYFILNERYFNSPGAGVASGRIPLEGLFLILDFLSL